MNKNNPTILQINVTANSGSTGRIAEQINQLARAQGFKTYLAYGRSMQPGRSEFIHVGNRWNVYEHYLEGRLFDNDGLASRLTTRKFIRQIQAIQPDIIHLHNLHGHWLNYRILFEYLNTLNIPIVWTTHDPWPFTGCGHFSMVNCYRWCEGGCTNGCPRKNFSGIKKLIEKTEKHFLLKKRLFTQIKNLTIVANSKWMESVAKRSYLCDKSIVTILNGVDVQAFKPKYLPEVLNKYGINNMHYVVGVATAWDKRKGIEDYKKLAERCGNIRKVVLVGMNSKQAEQLKKFDIITIPKTESVEELAAIYTGSDVVLNLSYEESFGLTSVEGYACGKPTVVYNCTASPELIENDNTGRIVEPGDIDAIIKAIEDLTQKDRIVVSTACRQLALSKYDKDISYSSYISLYNDLLNRKVKG